MQQHLTFSQEDERGIRYFLNVHSKQSVFLYIYLSYWFATAFGICFYDTPKRRTIRFDFLNLTLKS